jgi:hypothetical protein
MTLHMSKGHSATTAGKHTIYSIIVMGGDAYFAWVNDFDSDYSLKQGLGFLCNPKKVK